MTLRSVPGEGDDGRGAGAVFFDANGLVAARLAEHVQRVGHVRVGVDGRLWRYDRGVYVPNGDEFARSYARKILGDRFKRRHLEETIAWLRAHEATVTDKASGRLLNVRNGLLDWRTGELHPHDPEIVSTVQLGAAWSPDASCPRIVKFLERVLPADALELLCELLGYTIAGAAELSLRAAILLLGPGANGKSVLLAILRALLGPSNVSAIPLQAFSENRFVAAELFGKLANVCGDLDARAIRQTDTFKTATGGDELTAERKYGAAFTFTPRAVFWFSANEAPMSSDQSPAWFERWIVVPMEARLADEERDPRLRSHLTTPAELEGLLVLAVEGLLVLADRGRFDLPASVRGANDRYRERLDTVLSFVGEECIVSPAAWTPRNALYESYRGWCEKGGRLALSRATFNDHLRRNHEQLTETTRRGTRGWSGVGLLAGASDGEP